MALFFIFLLKNLPVSAKNSIFAANFVKYLPIVWNICLLVNLLRSSE